MSELIEATSRTVKTMADGTLRLTVDISPVHARDAFVLFGTPDAPVVLARLNQEAAKTSAQKEIIEQDKGGFLSQWLAMRCGEHEFWEFMESAMNIDITSKENCDYDVKRYLRISSKKEIDNDKDAEKRFHERIRLPYAKWLQGVR
jgi:hypothetical protein